MEWFGLFWFGMVWFGMGQIRLHAEFHGSRSYGRYFPKWEVGKFGNKANLISFENSSLNLLILGR